MLSDAPAIGDNPDWRYYDEYNQNTIGWIMYAKKHWFLITVFQ